MSEDSVNVKTPLFSLGILKKENQVFIKDDDTIIIRSWSWRKMKFIRKAVTKNDGKIVVQVL